MYIKNKNRPKLHLGGHQVATISQQNYWRLHHKQIANDKANHASTIDELDLWIHTFPVIR